MNYDYIEIGTSDFRTLIGDLSGKGISIEPVPCYFNNLPDGNKLNCAVSDWDGSDIMYYVNPDKITTEPKWVRGCNSIGKPHPTIEKDYKHLMESCRVKVISVKTLIEMYDITGVGFLKIDTEGHDLVIMNAVLDTDLRPERIQFEANSLIPVRELNKLLKRLTEYTVKKINYDYVCKLRHLERS